MDFEDSGGINKEYLDYLETHPEELEDEPPSCSCGTLWVKGVTRGTFTPCGAQRAMSAVRENWENYHLKKAQSLGIELSIHEFSSQRNSLFR